MTIGTLPPLLHSHKKCKVQPLPLSEGSQFHLSTGINLCLLVLHHQKRLCACDHFYSAIRSDPRQEKAFSPGKVESHQNNNDTAVLYGGFFLIPLQSKHSQQVSHQFEILLQVRVAYVTIRSCPKNDVISCGCLPNYDS